jgi:hypothetical protein
MLGLARAATRRFCAECGAALPGLCANCGFTNEPSAKFCGGRGKPIATGSRALPMTPYPSIALRVSNGGS